MRGNNSNISNNSTVATVTATSTPTFIATAFTPYPTSPWPSMSTRKLPTFSSKQCIRRSHTATSRPYRRAKLCMTSTSSNSNSNSNSSSNNSENENEKEPSNNEDEQQQHNPEKSQTSSSAQFNQEVLRRRMAQLNNSKSSNSSDTILDLSVVADGSRSDEEVLSTEITEESMSENDATEFIKSFDKLKTLWVILFTNSTDGSDGVYSLAVGDHNIVLAFEEKMEANRYAVSLEKQKFPKPQIAEMDPNEIRTFCHESNLKLGFIRKGMAITAPEESAIDDLDKWRGTPDNNNTSNDEDSSGMAEDDIDAMRKRLDTLFGK